MLETRGSWLVSVEEATFNKLPDVIGIFRGFRQLCKGLFPLTPLDSPLGFL